MRVSRKTKKKLRAVLLLVYGNGRVRKEKIQKEQWVKLYLKCKYYVSLSDRREANKVKYIKTIL